MTDKKQPLLPITLERTLSAISSYTPTQPLTVIIASYPKSGTTWMQNVIYELLALRSYRIKGDKITLDHISDYCPFVENDKAWVYDGEGPPTLQPDHLTAHSGIDATIFNTHLYLTSMPPSPTVKYIYMTRSPRDVCNSFYHHLSHQSVDDGGYKGSRSEFVKDWNEGKIAFGAWGDHLKSWLDEEGNCRDERCLRVDYSYMKKDIEGAVRMTARHIGVGEVTDEELGDIIPRLSVTYMKANIDKFEPRSVKWVDKGDGFSFVRKGNEGDGKKEFSEEDETVLKEGLEKFPPPRGCEDLL
ncbi:hypothetical protein TrST_g1323 [Triparma strigata]|uniref:Sulfotransferase domain-containing protein n=1 Tax=Triparma strigata TaxID=1606541 RepID=A0A9W7BAS8_9STRA|nr:hypothetical protein TrST_g1323 [Triparma strigata]